MSCIYKLKWLNGPLKGRELALPDGELRLGGADSDIALHLDNGVQATVSIAADAITLVSETLVWVAGQSWDQGQALPQGKVIDIAGQAFVLGLFTEELSMQEVPARLDRSQVEQKGKALYWCAVSVVCALLLGGLIFFLLPIRATPMFDLDAWLTMQLEERELSGLNIERDKQGGLTIKGTCSSSISVEGLRLSLRDKGFHLYDESVCTDALLTNVRSVLMLNGYRDIEVKSDDTPGHVVLFGNIVADRIWQRTSTQLRAIQALGGWRVVNDHAQLFNQLLASLAAKKLLGGLSINVSDGALRVSGQIDPHRLTKVTETLEAFNRKGSPRLLASFQNIPGAPSTSRYLPSVIVGVGGNKESPYVQLANGMRLQRGSVLPSGYLVYALDRSSMALLREQDLVALPLDL